jgi:hypothetical protein
MKLRAFLFIILSFFCFNAFADNTVYQQTTDYTCEASSIMNLLYYQQKVPFNFLSQRTEMEVAGYIGTTDPEGADTDLELQFLTNYGDVGTYQENVNYADINSYLDQGYIIMTEMYMYDDLHWIVVTKKDTSGYVVLDSATLNDQGLFNSPYVVSFDDFKNTFLGNVILVKSL